MTLAYANMDLFTFPSHTDTFGNVIREAFASGVPAVVTCSGGPKFLIEQGVTGCAAAGDAAFVEAVKRVMGDPDPHRAMGMAARAHALSLSWDGVFEKVYERYWVALSGQSELSSVG